MRNLVLVGIMSLFLSVLCNAQQLKVTPNVEPLVVEVPGRSAKEIYDTAKLYVAKRFKNPKFVTKADQENTLLRFEGYKFIKGSLMTEGEYRYTCELEFKDGKYRVSFFNLKRDPGIIKPESCFKNGELRKNGTYKTYITNFEDSINSELDSFNAFLNNSNTSSDW